ncbi:hemicentin-1-like [Mercenaria mercenaria]|uniref:hemicentin-1-like n=1 Tax=Mercenaria mercenaria TaxID=6596 RepID=UPI00234E9E5F|nr:hemicentin-1-like [Mercenaria mercenaria]
MNVNLLRWIFINIRLFPVIGKLSILMDNIDVTDVLIDPVKMFEGDSLVLECMSDRNNVTISWNRNYFITINNSLAIKNVRLADAGTYVCTGTGSEEDEMQNVIIDVLYPPSFPIIEGTVTGFVGEQVTLKCISNANPPPTYQWRASNQNGPLLSRNQTFQMTILEENQHIVCVAQSLMVTTLGRSRSIQIYRAISVDSYVEANVLNIENGPSWEVKEGEDINILCATVGQPAPDVWWTKVGNETFYFEGNRLIGYDIGQDFAGVYACNVDNTGISVNKTVVSTYDTKTIHLKMAKTLAHGDVFSAAECKNYCRRNSSAFGNTGRYKNLTWDGTNIPDKNEKDLIIMITAGIGWAALTIALFINILCCVFKKRKKTDEEKESETQTDETLEMFGYTYARSLPETPSSYITEVRFPESIYLDINNCDMLSTGQIDDTNISPVESYQTISSESTFLKPIFTSIHTNNYLSTSRL